MKTAVVTGASIGIGAATARHLARAGYRVVCAARRADLIEALASEIGGIAVACDITQDEDVARLVSVAGDSVDVLVNNAGGARGLEPVTEADLKHWQWMYEVNVLGTARVTKAFFPALKAAQGAVIFVTSTAADSGYEGGAGYCGVKAAERSMCEAMRLELFDTDVRVMEICPGMVATEEFSLQRFGGDQERAAAVYAGVEQPLTADDVADVIAFMATRAKHVNVDRVALRPRAQAAQHKVYRGN